MAPPPSMHPPVHIPTSPRWSNLSRRSALGMISSAALTVSLLRTLPLSAQVTRPEKARRILFLGDSITYAGTWVAWVETWFRRQYPEASTEFINLGLPSETVSGLSEPGHAGGSFPRPDLHERLGRALDQVKPDLVIANYGMNDGIYFPYSDERAHRHYDGLRRLHAAVVAAKADIIHLTPPTFDPLPLQGKTLPAGRDSYPSPFEGYDDVLHRYSQWLLAQRQNGWTVGDVHGPMATHLANRRKSDPAYVLAGDGVHPGPVGHWIMARELLRVWGAPNSIVDAESPDAFLDSHPKGRQIADLVTRRQNLLRDAWLSSVGHQRPGMGKGKPLPEATAEAQKLLTEIRTLTGR